MRPTVLLFDIDGTLLTTGGVGRRALARAFGTLHGREDACAGLRLDGMTDRAIVRQALQGIDVEPTDAAVDAVLAHYLRHLEDEVRRAPAEAYRLHPGMRQAVEAASCRQQVAVGLGTGNIREGARIKLTRVGLHDSFAFGGFGCDHEDRVELIRRGAQRGAAHLKAPLSSCRVVIIGDTPKDVAAAKGIGAECIGVGTGAFRPAELLACGADHAFEHLDTPGALEKLLG